MSNNGDDNIEIDKETLDVLRKQIIGYIELAFPDFYAFVGDCIQIQVGAAAKDILKGNVTVDTITEKVIENITPQIPQDVIDTIQNVTENDEQTKSIIDQVMKEAVKMGVTLTIKDLKR